MIVPDYIERSNRKTLSLTIMKDGAVCVKAPINMRDDLINKFVAEKQDWIKSKLSFINQNRDKFADIISYDKFLIYGNKYSLKYSCGKKIQTSNNFEILVPQKYSNDKLLKSLKVWYKKAAKEILTNRLKFIASKIKLYPKEVKIGDSKGRWGSCNSNDTIILNFRVIMLPPAIIDYVLVHELCHLKEMNHSKRFWDLVGSILPTYEKAKKSIKEYGFLLSLYN